MIKQMILTKTFFKHGAMGVKSRDQSVEVTMLKEFMGRNNVMMAQILMPTPVGPVKRFIERSKLTEKK